MIHGFADPTTADLWAGRNTSKVRRLPPEILERAFRKLVAIDAAEALDDLKVPPSNRLEKLKGNRSGQHSIRVNDQWRICFRWDSGAHHVELVDYHE